MAATIAQLNELIVTRKNALLEQGYLSEEEIPRQLWVPEIEKFTSRLIKIEETLNISPLDFAALKRRVGRLRRSSRRINANQVANHCKELRGYCTATNKDGCKITFEQVKVACGVTVLEREFNTYIKASKIHQELLRRHAVIVTMGTGMLVSEDELDQSFISLFFIKLSGRLESISRRMLSRNQYADLGTHMYGFGTNIKALGMTCLLGAQKELKSFFHLANTAQRSGDPVDEDGLTEAFQRFGDECNKLKEAYAPYATILKEAQQLLLNPNEL